MLFGAPPVHLCQEQRYVNHGDSTQMKTPFIAVELAQARADSDAQTLITRRNVGQRTAYDGLAAYHAHPLMTRAELAENTLCERHVVNDISE